MDTRFEPSRLIGPEDISRGDYVTVSHEIQEYVPWFSDDFWRGNVDAKRVSTVAERSGRPLRVVGVCQPFVLVQDVRGRHGTVDLRRQRLARLSQAFGEEAFRRMGSESDGVGWLCAEGGGI